MEVPKKIQKLIDRRERLAMDLIVASDELDSWLEAHGADFTDPEITDSTLTGCMIYSEPTNAKTSVESYIRNCM